MLKRLKLSKNLRTELEQQIADMEAASLDLLVADASEANCGLYILTQGLITEIKHLLETDQALGLLLVPEPPK